MNKPWKNAKWKKSDTKGHILHMSIDMKCLEKANLQTQEVGLGQGSGEMESDS